MFKVAEKKSMTFNRKTINSGEVVPAPIVESLKANKYKVDDKEVNSLDILINEGTIVAAKPEKQEEKPKPENKSDKSDKDKTEKTEEKSKDKLN